MTEPEKKGLQNDTVTVYRIGVEFVSGIFVGVLLGYAVDSNFKTKPWGLIGFLLLGAAAGFWNIYKLFNKPVSEKKGDEKND